ncbi:MAG: flagellar hook capping FlgD N-terminal domain-containing protein [Aquabacterium sp.]|uniref:flagellar hook assembly protein FlgD n=1 Tax=Aquabacterium sp. TaxID=1872578 RepID=UPI003BB0D0B7
MVTTTNTTNGIPNNLLNNNTAKSDKTTEASDRFLKLLVTQMQNQDPLNPMDNAQVTSQMAQINTVTGIDKLNNTVAGLNSSMASAQLMQSVTMVGRTVLLEGNKLAVDDKRVATGGVELTSDASNVKVEILSSTGATLDTLNLGAAKAGQHGFNWTVPENIATSGLQFKVTATSGSSAITSKPIMTDMVDAVSMKDGALNVQLRLSGDTAYSKIKALS